MTGLLSLISGQFAKSLILGAFFPIVVFSVLSLLFLRPFFPSGVVFLDPLKTLDTQWQLVTLTLVAIVLAGLLYNLNIPIIRLYEGYPWAGTWLGGWRKASYRRKLEALSARRSSLPYLVRELRRRDPQDPRGSRLDANWNQTGLELTTELPPTTDSVLPTQLGNVIRSFENYPRRQYGISAITLWIRLIAVIDKGYAASVDDAKTAFDFMINSSLLSAILAGVVLIAGLLNPGILAATGLWGWWLLELAVLFGLCYGFYVGSIGRAGAWGDTVKGAFDLYRWELLKQLGYTQLPATLADERALWKSISDEMIFGDTPQARPPRYAPAAAFAVGAPAVVALTVTRGINGAMPAPAPGQGDAPAIKQLSILLRVRNTDEHRRPAREIVVTDMLADGYEYVAGSAGTNGRALRVEGTNPYRFYLDDPDPAGAKVTLEFGNERLLSYHAAARKQFDS